MSDRAQSNKLITMSGQLSLGHRLYSNIDIE